MTITFGMFFILAMAGAWNFIGDRREAKRIAQWRREQGR